MGHCLYQGKFIAILTVSMIQGMRSDLLQILLYTSGATAHRAVHHLHHIPCRCNCLIYSTLCNADVNILHAVLRLP